VQRDNRVQRDLANDRILLLALVKEIEIIGEAAPQLSEEFRESSPEIPWAKIKGMRNVTGSSTRIRK
jgi:uncharacterized protein with HEPN domain